MIKKILFFSFILFAFTACEKDDPDTDFRPYVAPRNIPDSTGTGGGGGGIPGGIGLIATVDGKTFSPKGTNAQLVSNEIMISAVGGNNEKVINLSFPSTIKVGKHDFDANNINGTYMIIGSSGSTSYIAKNGPLLEITTIDLSTKKVSGNFHFVGYNATDNSDSLTVENGKFNLTLK